MRRKPLNLPPGGRWPEGPEEERRHLSMCIAVKSTAICPFFYRHIDCFADTTEPSHHIQIGKPKHLKPLGFQICCTLAVIFHFLRITVLGTVQFYHQFCFMTIEIHNIMTDHILSAKSDRIPAQTLIPQMSFFLSHISPQLLGSFGQSCILFHYVSPFYRKYIGNRKISPFLFRPSVRTGAPSPRGKVTPPAHIYTEKGRRICRPLGCLFSQQSRSQHRQRRRSRSYRRSWGRSRPGGSPAGTASRRPCRRPAGLPRWQP